MRCRKAGLTCGGYLAENIFVVSTPSRRQIGYSATDTTQTSSVPWQYHHWEPRHMQSQATSLHILARPAEERRYIDHFWEAYFPSGRPIPRSASRSYCCTWTATVRNLYDFDDSLRYALQANCLMLLGRSNGQRWMLREGSKLYGRALTCFRASLGRSQGANKDAAIATVKLLCMFEVPYLKTTTSRT